jgi:hypothetical protein
MNFFKRYALTKFLIAVLLFTLYEFFYTYCCILCIHGSSSDLHCDVVTDLDGDQLLIFMRKKEEGVDRFSELYSLIV